MKLVRSAIAFALCAISAALTTGCAAPAAATRQPAQEQPPLLPPATLGDSRDSVQILRGAFGEHEFVLRCVVRASPERIEVIGLTALGQRAFAIRWNGSDWNVAAAPMLPDLLKPQWLLADLQLALWPLARLQAAYAPAGWQVAEPGGGVRRLRHGGRLVAEVHYGDADPWRGRYWITNLRYGYALAIEPDSGVDATPSANDH
jgi:hypothetical protein